jgi:hypothetical protein
MKPQPAAQPAPLAQTPSEPVLEQPAVSENVRLLQSAFFFFFM